MQRIYLPNTQFLEILEITEKELYHQLTRVLRARVNQEVIFFDGINLEDHLYVMIHINKNTVSFRKKEVIEKKSELTTNITLYQAYPNKLSKFENIIQKCCEVWYKKIIFFESERSQKFVLSDNKKERLRKIAIEAIELCSGNVIPEILFHASFSLQDTELAEVSSLVCHTQIKNSIALWEIWVKWNINIIVWPEGGFSEGEVEQISDNWAQKVYFWNRILRCETAGEVVWFYLSQKK